MTNFIIWPNDQARADDDELNRVCEYLEDVLDERDALVAHVERLRGAGEQAVNGFSLNGLGDTYEAADLLAVLKQSPETSLARLKAQWQAEVLEGLVRISETYFIPVMGREEAVVLLDDVQDMATELRRQAEEKTR